MAPSDKQQLTAFVEGLMEIRVPKTPTNLSKRLRYQRWLLSETAFFFPNHPLVDVVLEVIAPVMGARYPH